MPVDEVEGGQQDLAGQEAVGVEPVLPGPHQPVLAHGGDGLEHGRVAGPLVPPAEGRPARRRWRPSVTTTTVCPGRADGGDLTGQAVDRRRR